MEAFRLIDTPAAAGAWNMAVDEVLAEAAGRGGGGALRFYRWEPACLSLGRNQPAAGEYDEARLRERGLDVVRRPTGGRAVLHAHELTYAVVAQEGALGTPRRAYAAINGVLVEGLRRLGVAATLQPGQAGRAPVPSLAPCFREPAEGEVVVAGRKLVGSAQVRLGGALLQHGSLLLSGGQDDVAALLRTTCASEDAGAATLAEHLHPLPSWAALVAALTGAWRDLVGPVSPSELSEEEMRRAAELTEKYRDLAWTWRR